MSSHRKRECPAQFAMDLESLLSHNLFDIVAYSEHNHLTAEGEVEKRKVVWMR